MLDAKKVDNRADALWGGFQCSTHKAPLTEGMKL